MTNSQPMSAQVRDQLIALFEARQAAPGDRVPSEAEIAELCNVGRSTAREALKLLEQDGIVLVERGRGRFLSSLSALHIDRPVTRFESTTSMLEALGYQDAKTLVLSAVEDAPDAGRAGRPRPGRTPTRCCGWSDCAPAATSRSSSASRRCRGRAFPAR